MITNPDFFVVPVDEVGGIELSDAFRKQGLHDRYNGTSPTSGVAVTSIQKNPILNNMCE